MSPEATRSIYGSKSGSFNRWLKNFQKKEQNKYSTNVWTSRSDFSRRLKSFVQLTLSLTTALKKIRRVLVFRTEIGKWTEVRIWLYLEIADWRRYTPFISTSNTTDFSAASTMEKIKPSSAVNNLLSTQNIANSHTYCYHVAVRPAATTDAAY